MTPPAPYAGTIVITAPTGSTVTATLGGKVYSAAEVGGKWTFKVRRKGSYAIRAVKGSQSAAATVTVTTKRTYTATLTYVTYISMTVTGSGKKSHPNAVTVASAGGRDSAGTYSLTAGSGVNLYAMKNLAGKEGSSSAKVAKIVVNGTTVASTYAKDGSVNYTIRPGKSFSVRLQALEGSESINTGSRYSYGVVTVTNYSATAAQALALENDHMALALRELGADTGGQSTAETVTEAQREQEMLVAALEMLGVEVAETASEDATEASPV